MGWPYRKLVRPIIFAQEAERAHNFALTSLATVARDQFLSDIVGKIFGSPELPINLFGLRFPNPVGLAAGMDKFAAAVPAWEKLGFGFCELGGVTWHAQPGNPEPRMFRAPADEAIVNRMGFNNDGAEALAQKLAEWKAAGRWPTHPVGINLGKSKVTPLDQAAEDYARSFGTLQGLADFFVINVSSPNTPNLRQLQDKAALDEILAAVQEINHMPSRESKVENRESAPRPSIFDPRPILIKIAPDLSFNAIDEILELAEQRHINGIVATNTTITRPKTKDPSTQKIYAETGGLSGKPLRDHSTQIVRHIYRQTKGKLPVIGVGGIFTADDAWEKIIAGASLVQVYTGMVYEGPSIAKAIVHGLIEKMKKTGVHDLSQVIGNSVK